MIFFRMLLLPISFIYGLLMQIRNLCYDAGLLKSHSYSKPVISVGNITAGGTGKTPFTIYLAKLLGKHGKKVAIISRGYGRQSKGLLLVSDGQKNNADTKLHGDEPALIALKVPQAIVAVCEKRSIAIESLQNKYEIDFFILDDAFQHRAVNRDIDIVLLHKKSFVNRVVLPSGLLREFYFNLKRADIIFSNEEGKPDYMKVDYQMGHLLNLNFEKVLSLEHFKMDCIAFAGIAYPGNFKNGLLQKEISVKKFIPFKDHYFFNEYDIDFLIDQCKSFKVSTLLCTEKDMVKIRQIPGIESKLSATQISMNAVSYNAHTVDEKSLLKKLSLT